jgi:ADP-ribose 1''-phosphate phosphatase
MSKVVHRSGDLFSALPCGYLAHACNCEGAWNSGVAYLFRQKFPASFKEYNVFCAEGASPGDVLVCNEEGGYQVICLLTSKSYGAAVDPPQSILAATATAVAQLPSDRAINMPRINAGLFKVPWEDTERVLAASGLDIIVWTPPTIAAL